MGGVQYDPLNPLGRNHDLVLQARVPGYSVGDWQELAYQQRFLYDAWDKQASLVMMRDYPMRRIYYEWHAPRWREAILDRYPEAVKTVLDELHERGPLSSTDFHYQKHHEQWEGSWYGPKLTKNVLRALWHTGQVHTCRRNKGKHVYDLAREGCAQSPLPGRTNTCETMHRLVDTAATQGSWIDAPECWSGSLEPGNFSTRAQEASAGTTSARCPGGGGCCWGGLSCPAAARLSTLTRE